jgi:hypothetical protein
MQQRLARARPSRRQTPLLPVPCCLLLRLVLMPPQS